MEHSTPTRNFNSKNLNCGFDSTKKNSFLLLFLLILFSELVSAQGPLTVVTDPNCTSKCCTYANPCNCSAGVIASGGIPPYTYTVFGPNYTGTTACATGLCPGTYVFEVRDQNTQGGSVIHQVTIGGSCCTLNCRDTSFCFAIADSAIHLNLPTYADTSGGGSGGTGGPSQNLCFYDSIWNNAPLVYPVGTTVVKWYVRDLNGQIDSCSQNVIRNPPSSYTLSFFTSPPIVGGVINICNGTPITFTSTSTGITGLLWNFGNGYYSSQAIHTEPAWHYPPGTYYDTLTVYDDCGFPHDTAFMVVVDSASGPDITCISVVCPGDTVTYHTNFNCTTYNWSVSGGTFIPIAGPPTSSDSATVVWGPGPTGTISLSVANCTPPTSCSIATVKTVNIVPTTLPVIGDTVVCAGETITYCVQCIPGNTHSWEILPANAGTVTGQGTCCITIQLNPTFFGPLTIQVNYNNVLTGSGCNLPETCSHDNGCGGTGTLTINVKPIFGISGPQKVCQNSATPSPFNGMNLTNNTIIPSTTWKLVTPTLSVLNFTTPALNSYVWATPGIYQLTAYAAPGVYCNDSAIVTVEVVGMLNPGVISGPDTVCAGVSNFYSVTPNMNGVTYTWTVSNGIIIGPANGNSVAIQWTAPGGSVTVVQTLTTSPFCVSVSSPVKNVVTWPNFPLPVITPSAAVACVKSTITYSFPPPLISNGTYTWSVQPATAGNIVSANGGNSITINWVSNAITPIFVKLKINRCYDDSVMFPVTLYSIPAVPSISYAPANPCAGNLVSFTTSSPGAWAWDFGEPSPSNLQNPTHTYNTAGNYNIQLVVTNPQGCSDTAKTTINIQAIPDIPVVTGPSSVCLNTFGTYTFPQNLLQGANYTWSLSPPALGNVISSSLNSITIQWTTPGTDSVKIRVQSPCIDTTIGYKVTVNALPIAGISAPSSACEGAAVTFSGSGGTIYSWGFTGGSPASSSSQFPVVTYSTTGTYNVTLSIVDANGCTANTQTSITINPLPIALISGPAGVCTFPATVTLTAVVAAGYTFAWSPGGATTSTITANISSPTTFSCVVTNAFGCTKTSNSITIGSGICDVVPGPCVVTDTINFTEAPPVCLSQTYTKTGNATHTGWTFGDGGSDPNPTSPVTHTFPYPGLFNVTIWGTATGVDPLGMPCSKVVGKTKTMTIPFDARFEWSFQCNGANQMMTNLINTSLYLNNPNSYNWTWYDNTFPGVIATGPFPAAVNLSAGTHNISLYIFDPVTMATCTTSHVIVVPVPITANFSVTAPICQGTSPVFTDLSTPFANEASRLFNNGDGATSTLAVCSLYYTNFGNIPASLSVTDIYGCTSVSTQILVVKQAGTGTITPGSTACDSVSLTASCCSPYTWSVISPPPPPSANPVYVKISGFYKVTGIAPNGCPYTAGPVFVTVKQSPVATISGKTQYCQGEALDLKTTVSGTVSWTQLIPFGGVVGSLPNLNVIPPGTGLFTYQVTVTGSNGCSSTATIQINVDPVPASPSIVASGPLTFCQGDSVILSVSPTGATYLWSKSPTPALTSPANTQPTLTVTTSGTYSVIVQTASGCLYPAIPPKTVTVNPIPPANITGDTVVCVGETLILQTTNVGGGTYSWNGPGASGNTNPFVNPNMQLPNAGQYNVVVTNSYGCTNSDSINVIVNPTPPAPFITSNPGGVLCEGQLVVLTASPAPVPPVVYTWSTNQLGGSITVAMAGNYSVIATNQFGCTAGSNVITIHPLPDLSCAPSGCYEFCNECDSVEIPGPGGLFSYNWQTLVGNTWTFYSSNQNIWVLPPGGAYRLLAANQWGCSDSTDTLKIDFNDCCPPIDSSICIDTCTNFNNATLNGFIPNPSAPNVIVGITNVGSQGGVADYFLTAQDQPGPSQLLAGDQFDGKWCCGEFCFDYKMVNNGGINTSISPQFVIRNGTLGFTFTSSVPINDQNWHTICAPITDCAFPPSSPAGTWAPIAGTVLADWPNVLSYVTDVIFRVNYNTSPAEISGFDNICIHTNIPDVDAGNDTTICEGTVLTLQATGCNSIPQWYQLNPDGPIFINNGPIIDVSPTQNTCYVVICCGAGTCCCDTDTVCVTVNPKPKLQWPLTITVCLNSPPVTLNPSNILVYVNNAWVPVTSTNGTGVFSGPNVVGNIFTASILGPNVITYTYTDSLGCSASISNTILVINCNNCDTSQACQISAGPDQVICQGQPAILGVTNCNSTPSWYEITPEGNFFVNNLPQFDVFPQQSTCYMVICCNPAPCCCDTDTVCIIVNPHPILQWPLNMTVCLNSAPVTLNASTVLVYVNNSWVPVTSTNGTGYFSGPNVGGNVFTPSVLGPNIVTYTYTDSLGCTASISQYIVVINCTNCDTSQACQISAGPDQVICQGQPAVLSVTGCNTTPTWYQITQEGNIFIGNNPVYDIFPQQSGCYMVICCNPAPCCCDTDTVCITVNPHPILSWPLNITVCHNSGPVTLNASTVLVYVNNTWVPVTSTNGTGFFSGPNVVGNIFTPSVLGPNVITYTYTDSLGCTASVNQTIIVRPCTTCDTSAACQINAGPDQVICQGQPAILNVTNCNSIANWFKIAAVGEQGNTFVGSGQTIDIFPQQSGCYYVICCNPAPCCCDTDTICITVNPHPVLQWPINITVCLNSAPITLDPNTVLVYVNNTWVPVTSTNGTGYFSGPNVVGNIFTPSVLGPNVITYTYTDSLGCSASVSQTINVINCTTCDTSAACQIDAGPDQVICQGQPAILNVSNCNSVANWFKIAGIGEQGNTFVGSGETLDIFPQQSGCYIVICCNPAPCCCDTDTVCITVNPHPVLQWPLNITLCLNSAPITLNASTVLVYVNNAWVPVTSTNGTGYFSGSNVAGNIFTPSVLGPNVITYTYTDSLGCSASISQTINVINCNGCDTSQACQISAGPDQVICQGNPAILNVTNCNSNPSWYQITAEGNILVGNGPVLDVFPQQTTCYIVICCNPAPCCCDTDTVCITVSPHPVLQWPLQLTLCLNGPSVTLNASGVLVYVNNAWVPVTSTNGTGYFSGPNVVGNVFTPSVLGPNIITYTYTDSLGCTASISQVIMVINCGGCEMTPACQISAGPDQIICQGDPAILNVTGCNSTAHWYKITATGNILIGNYQTMDIFPQQSGCYMVICCNPAPCCCDTDTVCITVKPKPILQWQFMFTELCSGLTPIVLSPADIYVYVNNTWVSVVNNGGTGFFSGPGVSGNTFTPTTAGTYIITYTYTAPNGCTASVTNTIIVIDCGGCNPPCNCNSQPPPPLPTITVTSVTADSCNGRGCINVSFTGCCLMYSYSYFNPCNPALSYSIAQTSNPNIFCNISAGTYIIFAQDGCGNVVQQTVTVPLAAPPLAATVSYSNCTETICVNVEGGCPPYSYSWSGGQTGSCISGSTLCATQTVTITDSRGCSIVKQVWIPRITFGGIFNPSCCLNNGRICVNVCSDQPYTLTWNTGATTNCLFGIGAGTYCVTVVNAAGDVITCCYTLNPAPAPDVTFTVSGCGTLVTPIIHGNGCNYTYHWENNSTQLERSVQPCDSITFTLIDCYGIPHVHGFRVPSVTGSISPVSCVTGLGTVCLEVQCFGCPPYTYETVNQANITSNCFQLPPGFHNICITNACGDVICCQIILPHPIGFTLSSTQTNVTCYGGHNGTVTITPSGGTAPYVGAGTFTGLSAGVHVFTVTDANGCTQTITVTITQPPLVVVGPFTPTGCIGQVISISGNNFVGVTGVLFNGVAASNFQVISATHIEAQVPVQATTGPITVLTFPCATISANIFTVIPCGITVNVNVYLEGYYAGGGVMDNFGLGGCLYLNGLSTSALDADSLFITLVDPLTLNPVETQSAILHTNGNASATFSSAVQIGASYYLQIRHRNALETWSSNPVVINPVTNYNFTTAQSKAYGNNMIQTFDGLYWAFYSGDISDNTFGVGMQDNVIESQDYLDMENAVQLILTGYVIQDITGDGVVESADYIIMENNVSQLIFTLKP